MAVKRRHAWSLDERRPCPDLAGIGDSYRSNAKMMNCKKQRRFADLVGAPGTPGVRPSVDGCNVTRIW